MAWTPIPGRRQKMLSLAYSKMDRRQDALDAATKAVDLCKGDEASCIEALGRRAAAHAALGDAPSALADLNAALDFIEGLRNRLVPTDLFKQDFNHAQQDIYSQAIALQVQEKQERQALETAELAQVARISRSARQPRCPGEGSRPPADRVAAERGLRYAAAVQSHRFDGRRPRAGSDASRRARRAASSSAAPDGPRFELRSFAIASPPPPPISLATAARLRSTLVVYWVGEDELFIWAVLGRRKRPCSTCARTSVAAARAHSRDRAVYGIGAHPRRPDARSSRAVNRRFPIRADKAGAWRALYDVLIQPIRERAAEDLGRAADHRSAGTAAQRQLRGAPEPAGPVPARGLRPALRAGGRRAAIHRAEETRQTRAPDRCSSSPIRHSRD